MNVRVPLPLTNSLESLCGAVVCAEISPDSTVHFSSLPVGDWDPVHACVGLWDRLGPLSDLMACRPPGYLDVDDQRLRYDAYQVRGVTSDESGVRRDMVMEDLFG